MGNDDDSIVILHKSPSPYRLPLFEKLADRYNLKIIFCTGRESGRIWDTEPEAFDFESRVLDSKQIGPFIVSFGLLKALLEFDADTYLIGEDSSIVLSTILTVFYAILTSSAIVFWVGDIPQNTVYKLSETKSFAMSCYRVFQRFYRRFLYKAASHFVAYSRLTEQYLSECGVSRDKISIGGQVMPEENLPEPVSGKMSFDDDRPVVLALGYLEYRKGFDLLLGASERIVGKCDHQLVIAGDGEYRTELEEMASHMDHVQFTGYVEGGEKSTLYEQADIFVLPTRHDPWGLVVNEALYFDTPVITSSYAGVSTLVKRDRCGTVITGDDEAELRRQLERMLAGDMEKYRRNAEDSTRGHDLEGALELFEEALEASSRNPQ